MSPEVRDAFKSLEISQADVIGTHTGGSQDRVEDYGPHHILLPKGARAEHIKLTPYQQFCWRVLGDKVRRSEKTNPALEEALISAHLRIRPDELTAMAMMTAIILLVVGIVVAIVLIVFLMGMLGMIALLLAIMLPILLPVAAYGMILGGPKGKAKARGKSIDLKLPSVMSFISALASADVNIDVIFKELSRQDIFGEIKGEAEWITRDTELLGVDILNAIKNAADRTPSQPFQDFLQGVVTTTSAGGKLKPYFLLKSEQYEQEQRLENKGKFETLGMLAESFVTVGVAFPLFLVVMMAIMALVGSDPDFTVMMLYVIAGGMIPGTGVGFLVGIDAIGGEKD